MPREQAIAHEMQQYLDEAGWKYETETVAEDAEVIRFGYTTEHTSYRIDIICRQSVEVISIYTEASGPAPMPRIRDAADFVVRANDGLVIGNFELDVETGILRYKTSADLEGAIATTTFYKHLLLANISTMDRYYPGWMRMLWSELSPADAIASVEHPDDPALN